MDQNLLFQIQLKMEKKNPLSSFKVQIRFLKNNIWKITSWVCWMVTAFPFIQSDVYFFSTNWRSSYLHCLLCRLALKKRLSWQPRNMTYNDRVFIPYNTILYSWYENFKSFKSQTSLIFCLVILTWRNTWVPKTIWLLTLQCNEGKY